MEDCVNVKGRRSFWGFLVRKGSASRERKNPSESQRATKSFIFVNLGPAGFVPTENKIRVVNAKPSSLESRESGAHGYRDSRCSRFYP